MRVTFICIRCLICPGYGGGGHQPYVREDGWQEDQMYGEELDFGTQGRVTDEVQEGTFLRRWFQGSAIWR